MPTMVPNRRSSFGINCVRCKGELIAPEKSEYVTARTSTISGIALTRNLL